jgi:hypothetical protein
MPGVSRDAIDRVAVDAVAVMELPGAHGKPSVLVPRGETALALRLHGRSYRKHLAPHFANGDISEAALHAVSTQVCRVLGEGPMSSADIRRSITHPESGSLLVVALMDLTLAGVIRRFPADGRLDSTKYLYEGWHQEDRPDLDAEGNPATVAANATKHFLRRHGPATLEELMAWSELTKHALREALETIGAERLAVPHWTGEAWLLPRDMPAWQSFTPERSDRVVLLPYRDPFVHMRRGPSVLVRTDDARVLDRMLKPVRIVTLGSLNQHTIVSGGDIVGVWEYDAAAATVLTRLWDTDAGLRRRVECAAAETSQFIREQIGDAKLSALDPPAKRAKRLAFCRAH